MDKEMRTPWFTHEYIIGDAVCAERIRGMARAEAEDALYAEPGEHVIHGIAA